MIHEIVTFGVKRSGSSSHESQDSSLEEASFLTPLGRLDFLVYLMVKQLEVEMIILT